MVYMDLLESLDLQDQRVSVDSQVSKEYQDLQAGQLQVQRVNWALLGHLGLLEKQDMVFLVQRETAVRLDYPVQ